MHAEVAYETFGTLNHRADNAVFVCHALTGDSHAARHSEDDLPGWWDVLVGPGKAIDTERYFVICANVLGGCYGSTGPVSLAPGGGWYGLTFPPVEIDDMVDAHRALLERLGIRRLAAVVGGSFGGMQALDWLLRHPDDAKAFLIIAGTARHSAENVAYHSVGRAAIRSDPEFHDGDYPPEAGPKNGLAIARMAAHLSYLSDNALDRKFGRDPRTNDNGSSPIIHGPFAVESYLEHQANKLTARFDARSYLYITSAMDRFDPFGRPERFATPTDPPAVHLISFAGDPLYGVGQATDMERRLADIGIAATHFTETTSTAGHDALLLAVPPYQEHVARLMRG